jgi:hypothetical protein
MSVYILTVIHIANLSYNKNSFYIDSIFDSEEKAWNRIEEKFYNFLPAIFKNKYKIREICFKGKRLIVEYENRN